MKNDFIIRPERLLIIDPEPQKLVPRIEQWLSHYEISILSASTGIEGMEKFKLYPPGLVLLNCELPDISGMSVASIIKDGKDGADTFVILYNFSHAYQNTKADLFFVQMEDDDFDETMSAQLTIHYTEKFTRMAYNLELRAALRRQYQQLPGILHAERYSVLNFSPLTQPVFLEMALIIGRMKPVISMACSLTVPVMIFPLTVKLWPSGLS